jgi:general secretion pathway protein K
MTIMSKSSGFVMPLVLVAIAAFALSAMTLARTVDFDRSRLARMAKDVEFERRATIAEARLAHLVLTEPTGAGALLVGGDRTRRFDAPNEDRRVRERVKLDGEWYELVVDGVRLEASLQDEAGLVNLNGRDPTRLARLFESQGIASAPAQRLAERVADFVDEDDLRRPNGAERRDYEGVGLVGPRNASFSVVDEAAAVLGWNEELGAARARVQALMRVAPPDAPFNVNSAQPEAIAAVLSVDARRSRDIVRRREGQIVRDRDELAALAGGGMAVDDLLLTAAPARTLRVRVRAPEADHDPLRLVFESSLVLAEPGVMAPIGIGRRRVLVDADVRSNDDRTAPLPDRRSLLAR